MAPSGFGKSTLGKIMAGWINRFRGTVALDGEPLRAHQPCRVQYINQNPEVSVNPRWRMGRILTECWPVDEDTKHQLGIEDAWPTSPAANNSPINKEAIMAIVINKADEIHFLTPVGE